MSIDAKRAYSVSLNTAAEIIMAGGHERTILVEGHMGFGKTSIPKIIQQYKPNHKMFYFDCNTKDLGDLALPGVEKGANGNRYSEMIPNWELGMHEDGPIVVMFDEWGKANPSVKLGTLAFMLERRFGAKALHPDSIVFATTNLASENVGDILPAHARNRLSVLRMRKPTNVEWIEWGITAGIDPAVLGWCKDNPQLFNSFEEYKEPNDNPYIYHPRSTATSFVTGRSLHAASDWIKKRDHLSLDAIRSVLLGTIGDQGALDLMGFVELSTAMPRLEDIKSNPKKAMVPKNPAAVCMTVYRTLSTISGDWIDAWMTYMERLDLEAQALFANGVAAASYSKERQAICLTHKALQSWAILNNHLYVLGDKK